MSSTLPQTGREQASLRALLRHPLLDSTLGAALRHPRVEPTVSTLLRASVVKESAEFAARELARSRVTRVYRLRETGMRVAITHRSADVHALDQAFYQHAHEPPPAARARLEEIGRPLRALDLGAHIGMWGLWLHGRFPVRSVLALEPDPRNAAQHRRQIELNGLGGSWEVREAAAVRADGEVSFTIGQATNGRVTRHGQAGSVTVAGLDAFALADQVDLLKIDIEGGEWSLIDDPRFLNVQAPVVMLEYHDHDAPSEDPHGVAAAALERAGYLVESTEETARGFGVVWGCKTGSASA